MEKCIGCELCAAVCPADCIYVRGADNPPDAPGLARRALRVRLRDQLPALHPLRPVRRGLPDRGHHRVEALRVLLHESRRRHLHQGTSSSSTTTAAPATSRGRTGARARTSTPLAGCGRPRRRARRRTRARCSGRASSATGSGRPRAARAASVTTRPPATSRSALWRGTRSRVVSGARCTERDLTSSPPRRSPTPSPSRSRRSSASSGRSGSCSARNPVHSALMLVMTLFGIAVLFVEENAQFLAAVQVIVYAGAIVVLFLFVIMLLGVDRRRGPRRRPAPRPAAGRDRPRDLRPRRGAPSRPAASGPHGPRTVSGPARQPGQRTSGFSGDSVFTTYLLAFEVTSALLVIAVVGAVVLARRPRRAAGEDGSPIGGPSSPMT